MNTNNRQSAAKPLLNEESSETILNGVGLSNPKSEILDIKISNKDMVQSLRKLKVVNSLYIITNIINNYIYIGITKRNLNTRFRQYIQSSKRNNTFSKLHNAIRKYGENNFKIELLETFDTYEELLNNEIIYLKNYKSKGYNVYNILEGGRPLPKISNKEIWKEKLKIARKGRKPALGMKHSEENKKLFSYCAKYKNEIYGIYPKEVINFSFKESNKIYGISKTHYYRLLKQNRINDSI